MLPALPAATVCWRKEEVEEEQKRLRELRLRENLIRNLGVAKQVSSSAVQRQVLWSRLRQASRVRDNV